MTPRERVVKALNHEAPDRVPVDLGGTESSSMTAMAYNRLRDHLGLPQGRTRIIDVYQQIVDIEDDVREAFEIDTIPLHIMPRQWQPSTLPDGSRCEVPVLWNPVDEDGDLVVRNEGGEAIARMPEGGFYFEPIRAPLDNVADPAELDERIPAIEAFDWPSHADESLNDIAARAKDLHESTDYAIVGNLQLHLLAAGQILRGYENFMVDLLVNKPLAHAVLERLTDVYVNRSSEYLSRVGGDIDVVLLNDDLGTQAGPMLSLECYREMILPYQKRLFRHIKKNSDAALLLHSCGSVRWAIPDLIEAGVDALNPIQVSAAEMDSASLKAEFGDLLTFWGGGCDTQRVLNSGSPGEIEDEVKRRMCDLSPGGGFVFAQVHNIQPDVPPENVAAMFEAVSKYR